jgi:hypothetical protein
MAAVSSSGSSSSSSSGSAGHLRQRMSKMNMRQSLLPSSQSIPVATLPLSVGGSGVVETGVVGLRIEKKSGIIGPSVAADDDIPKYQKKEKAKEAILSRFDNRHSWIDIDGDTSLDTVEVEEEEEDDQQQQEVEEGPEDLYEILDRFENRDNDIHHHSSSSEQALERSHSFKAGKLAKEKRSYPDNSFNNARPPPPRHHHQQHVPAADLYGFADDDGKSVGDRTSRWSESVYSRSSSTSILDEEESEEMRDRFVRRVEAMLDAEKKAQQAQAYMVPPLPEIPHAYANVIHRSNGNGNGNINENAGRHSNITPGRSWNKF